MPNIFDAAAAPSPAPAVQPPASNGNIFDAAAAPKPQAGAAPRPATALKPPPVKKTYEQPKGVRENPLRTIVNAADVPLAYQEASFLDMANLPESLKPIPTAENMNKVTEDLKRYGPSYVAEHDVAFRKGALEDVLANPNASAADRATAQFFLAHPKLAGAGDFITEFANVGLGAFGHATEAGLKYVGAPALRATREAIPAVDRAITAAESAGNAARVAALKAFRKTLEPIEGAPASTGAFVRSLYDRYAGLAERGGTPYVSEGLAAQAAPDNAENHARSEVRNIFNGLTPEQKKEVVNLSYRDEHDKPIYTRDAHIPEPAPGAKETILARVQRRPPKPPPTLEQRAVALKKFQWKHDVASSNLGTAKELKPTGMYVPMRQFGDHPVYKSQDLAEAAKKPDAESEILKVYQARGKGRYAGTQTPTGRQTQPPLFDPSVAEDLHPEFDPAYQFEEHYAKVARANANEAYRRHLESVPGGKAPTTITQPGTEPRPVRVRMPAYYGLPNEETGPIVFGYDTEGKKARDRYIHRQVEAPAVDAALNDPAMQAYALQRRVQPSLLGTRSVIAKAVAPYRARLQEATNAAKRAGRNVAGYSTIAKNAQRRLSPLATEAARVKNDLAFNAKNVGDALNANARQRYAAVQGSEVARENARRAAQSDAVVARLSQQGPPTPAKTQILAEAKRLADEAKAYQAAADEPFERVITPEALIPSQKPGMISAKTPAAIRPEWAYVKGKWVKSGEYADIPKRYLDLSGMPDKPPSQLGNLVAKHGGNIDDLATQVSEYAGREVTPEDILQWVRNRSAARAKNYVSNFMEPAAKRIADALKDVPNKELANYLESIGIYGKSPALAREYLRKTASELADEAEKLQREAEQREFAESELGPPARALVGAAERSAQRVGELSRGSQEVVDKTLADSAAKAAGLHANAVKRVSKNRLSYQRRLEITETAAEFNRVVHHYYKEFYNDIAEDIRSRSVHAPPGYTLESSVPGLGSPSNRDTALDDAFVDFFTSGQTLRAKELEQAKKTWNAFRVLNRLSRASIVLIPTVHGINNLGMMFLAEGGDPSDLALILAGKKKFSADLVNRAFKSGAATKKAVQSFQLGDTAHATTEAGSLAALRTAKMGALAKAAQPLVAGTIRANRAYQAMNSWLFDTVENGYALSLFEKFTKGGMSDGDAALRVRNALGRHDNISDFERKWNLQSIFYFYPWMKTVIPFWVKKGLIDPRWYGAPIAGVETNNQIVGYDDPSRPFTATLWKNKDGTYQRATLPMPQRVLEPISNLARIPGDLVTGHPQAAGQDALSGVNYVTEHFNPFFQTGVDLGEAAHSGTDKAAPWNTFKTDPSMTPAENYKNWGENLLARFFSPAERVQQGIQNPGAALGAFLAGSTTYATKPPSEKKLEQKVRSLLAEPNHDTIVNLNAAVAAAEENGDEAGAERAQEIIRKIRATQEALFNAWLERRRQGLKPLPTASPATAPAAGGNIFDPATSGGNPFAPSP